MSQSTYRVIERWLEQEAHGASVRSISSHNCFYEGPVIYSYGHHFPLARAIKGDAGETTAFLLNGDTYSMTTSRQQADVRNMTRQTGIPTVIVPFTVLNEAGIDHSTVRILDVSDDRWEETTHTSEVELEGWKWANMPIREYVAPTDDELQVLADEMNERARRNREGVKDSYNYAVTREDAWAIEHYGRELEKPVKVHTIDDVEDWRRKEYRVVRHERQLFTSGRLNNRVDVHDGPDGRWYEWTTSRHWLGESLIEGEIRWQRFRRCRACRGTGRARQQVQPLEIHPMTDVLMVPEYDPWQDGVPRPWGSSAPYQRTPILCERCEGRGGRWLTGRRRARFLSGFDHNETRPSYFFAELPPGATPSTVAEAYETLKPEPVKLAEGMGRDVKRQGDIFAVELRAMDKRDLRKAGATFEKRGNLLGTNHVATEVARMPDGTTLARGTLTHAPENRAPDHRRVKLGQSWHVTLKNLVPIAA
jgi:hypothetical protein